MGPRPDAVAGGRTGAAESFSVLFDRIALSAAEIAEDKIRSDPDFCCDRAGWSAGSRIAGFLRGD